MKYLFGSHKGGPGKSTLAVNFAISLAQQDRDVLLVDSDPQNSATLWQAIRSREKIEPQITCMSAYGANINSEIEKLAKKFDDVVIDTAGHDSIELRAALVVANVLITPVEIALFSTATLSHMQTMIRSGRPFNRDLRCYLVPNRVSTHHARGAAQLARLAEASDLLNEYQLTRNALRERVSYSELAEQGRTVGEGSDHKAKAEFDAVFQEITHGH